MYIFTYLFIQAFVDPAIVLSMFMLSLIFVVVFVFYICIAIRDLVIKKGRVGITLTGLILPHFCACPKPEPGFPPYILFHCLVQ